MSTLMEIWKMEIELQTKTKGLYTTATEYQFESQTLMESKKITTNCRISKGGWEVLRGSLDVSRGNGRVGEDDRVGGGRLDFSPTLGVVGSNSVPNVVVVLS
ncbi:unnamed protein product [Cercopithifilaria johnstoni]|uniref:Uncharacterized protein n=1 Tax=Cercopithifilaria johnstoni TaxID=2874296 RepID=A0A8J2Q0U9_9BILA|nr:unnamed protein product [Cercopithifilaria johnstoni]